VFTSKQIKEAEKSLTQQQRLVGELDALVKDIERCENITGGLKSKLEAANAKFQGQRTTRQEIDYLTILLDCAKKKLAWEKQLASLQKRTPQILENMAAIMNDTRNPPADPIRAQILAALERVQSAMSRLQGAKVE
jgi:predicted RNase H-like nuclease (RuvC/YqgF family)